MMVCKILNLNGLKLDGSSPATPRTREFCESKGMFLSYAGGKVSVTGNFSLNKSDVDTFLKSKIEQDGLAKEDKPEEANASREECTEESSGSTLKRKPSLG